MKITHIFKNYYRLFIAILVSLEIGLTIVLCDQYLHSQSIMLFAELLMSIIVISMIILLMNKNDELEKEVINHKTMISTAPFASIIIDLQANKAEISPSAQQMLGIHLESTNINALLARLPLNLFCVIEEYINNPQSNQWYSKEGVINFVSQKLQGKYLKYKLSYTPLLTGAFYGIIIWLQDISASKETEIGLIQYMHKYRAMSYELETLFSTLPFPVWKRQPNGEIIFYNSAFMNLMQEIGLLNINSKNGEIENAINNLFFNNNSTINEPYNSRRIFNINNQAKHIDFHEIISTDDKIIGYAEDVTENVESEKELNKANKIITELLNLSLHGTVILNNQQKVIYFNNAFANFLNISPSFLAKSPNYGQVIDKMREANSLPEIKDFAKYKDNLMNELRTSAFKTNHLYLPNGQMYNQTIACLENGISIINYTNVTNELTLERHYNELLSVYKTILNNHVDPICIYGQDGKLKMYNNKFATLIGKMQNRLNQQPHFSEVIKWQAELANNNQKEMDELHRAIVASIEGHEAAEVKLNSEKPSISIQPLPDNTVLIRFGNG
jgi:PAS domain-containing protein